MMVHRDSRRVLVPDNTTLQEKLVSEHHETPLAGHFGVRKTLARMTEHLWWPGMKEAVEKFVAACDVCQRTASATSYAGRHHQLVARQPWEVVTIDFVCGFAPTHSQKHTSCMVGTDKFTRQVHFRSCRNNPSAAETTQMFLEMVVARHGMPSLIISDRGHQFESTLWHGVLQALGSRCALASTHHPQTNGATERVNRTLIGMIKKFAHEHEDQWGNMLPLFEFAFNSAIHSATGVAPFVAELGRLPTLPVGLLKPRTPNFEGTHPSRKYITELMERLHQIRKLVLANNYKTIEQRDLALNSRDYAEKLVPGDEVLLLAPYLVPEGSLRKHAFRWKGPYLVNKEITDGAFELLGTDPGVPTVYHASKLRRYVRSDPSVARLFPPAAPLELQDGELIWEVESVQASKLLRGKKYYLVKWKGVPECTWEEASNLEGCQDLVQEFEDRARARRS